VSLLGSTPLGMICCGSLNHLDCYPALETADLSRNLALARFELHVGYPEDLIPVLSPLRKTLSTISSPAFSEFTLKFEYSETERRFLQFVSGEVVRGDEWGMIDRDLNDMGYRIGRDIQLVVQVGAGIEVWSPTRRTVVGDVFPLMNARGLVSVEVVPRTYSLSQG